MSRQLVEVRHLVPVIFLAGVQQPCKDVRLPGGGLVCWSVERRWYLVAPGSTTAAPRLTCPLICCQAGTGPEVCRLQTPDLVPSSSYPAYNPPSYLDINLTIPTIIIPPDWALVWSHIRVLCPGLPPCPHILSTEHLHPVCNFHI